MNPNDVQYVCMYHQLIPYFIFAISTLQIYSFDMSSQNDSADEDPVGYFNMLLEEQEQQCKAARNGEFDRTAMLQ